MSWLSKVTGIGINPLKGKIKIDPLKALGTVATVGSLGSLGPLAGLASHIPMAGRLASLASTAGTALKAHGVGDLIKGGLDVAGGISGMVSAAKAGKKESQMMGNQAGIANSMNSRGGSMADAASRGLLARIAAGPRATPDFSRFVDRANPFSGQFAPPPVAPPLSSNPAPLALPAPQLPPPPQLGTGIIPPARRLPAPRMVS